MSSQGLESDNLEVTYLYCGSGFTNSTGLNMNYIQDGQHPSVQGYEALGRCKTLQPPTPIELVFMYITAGIAIESTGSTTSVA